ncbi:MAG: hypothetical protein NDI73_08640 [Desulfuromonadales bacterium]|nr:hypothetical protein [Desulfuromonadales bacterium]
MKKIIAITLLLLYVATGSALAAAAASGTSDTTGTGGLGLNATAPTAQSIARASKGVFWGWTTGTGGYALDTIHMNGTKAYGTGYDSTKIYFMDTTVAAFAEPADSNTEVAFPDGTWTPM